MTPQIKMLQPKLLIGQHRSMNLVNDQTGILWSHFAPRIPEIPNRASTDKISLQRYPPNYHKNFNPDTPFEKWAAVEVTDLNTIPEGMHSLRLEGGLYAVFQYKGSSADNAIYHYIFSEWLPSSDYDLDHRPHFEILGAQYKPLDPHAEEDIWIPIKKHLSSKP